MYKNTISDNAAGLVKSYFEDILKKNKKTDNGKWHAISGSSYLFVFNISNEVDRKVQEFISKGMNPFKNLARAWTNEDLLISDSVHSIRDCNVVIQPKDNYSLEQQFSCFFTENATKHDFDVKFAFVLGIQQSEAWEEIETRLKELINENLNEKVDYSLAYNELKKLIQDSASEPELVDFITRYKLILLPSPFDFHEVDVTVEITTSAGIIDFMVIARQDNGNRGSKAYIWEFKNASSTPFKLVKKRGRGEPTNQLIGAENQLFHYFHRISEEEKYWLGNYSYINKRDVKLGGVIIGSDSNLITISKNIKNPAQYQDKGKEAFRLREQFIYEKNNMMLLTWSDVLRRLNTQASYFNSW
ncbi:MAG TPA: hypothetical protein DEG92_04225 [Rikenellaceae bacterium]|nr:hypothetical protein [Rikenellaceae bacterium]